MYTSPALVDKAEWKVSREQWQKAVMEKIKLTKPPTLQDVKVEMETSDEIIPEIFKTFCYP